MPKIDIKDLLAARKHVDDPDVLERLGTEPLLRVALEMQRPENWWGLGIPGEELVAITREDGLPLAHVLPSHLVRDVHAATDREARLAVLLAAESEILDACGIGLARCTHQWLADVKPLADASLAAWRAGHSEAATALAAIVCDPLSKTAVDSGALGFESRAHAKRWEKLTRTYTGMSIAAGMPEPDSPHTFVKRATIAPVHRFFTEWHSDSGTPPPRELSRHVFAHNPTVGHFTRDNGLVALLLMCSLLVDSQDWCTEVELM